MGQDVDLIAQIPTDEIMDSDSLADAIADVNARIAVLEQRHAVLVAREQAIAAAPIMPARQMLAMNFDEVLRASLTEELPQRFQDTLQPPAHPDQAADG